MQEANRDASIITPPPGSAAGAGGAGGTRMQAIPYQSSPRAGGAMIDLDSGGATIDITYRNQRVWGMVIGFGLVALAPTAKIIYDATIRPGSDPPSPVLIAAAVLFAMLALASGVRGHTPALHLVADPGGLRMRGGVLGEDLQWRRDEIVAVTAEDLEPPQVSSRRISIVIEFSGDEYVVFPLATREEQAAVVEALRIALKLTPPEPDRVRPVDV